MLSNAKKLIITTALIGVAAVAAGLTVFDFGNPTLTAIEQIAQDTALDQEDCLSRTGKYCHIKTQRISGMDVTTHEYELPTGGVGYWTIFENNDFVRSIGFGTEKKTFLRIKEIINATST